MEVFFERRNVHRVAQLSMDSCAGTVLSVDRVYTVALLFADDID